MSSEFDLTQEHYDWVLNRDTCWSEHCCTTLNKADSDFPKWMNMRRITKPSLHHIISKFAARNIFDVDESTINSPYNLIYIEKKFHFNNIHDPQYIRAAYAHGLALNWNTQWDTLMFKEARLRTEWYLDTHGNEWPRSAYNLREIHSTRNAYAQRNRLLQELYAEFIASFPSE